MLKYIILLINSISILLFNLFFGDGVTVTANLPSKASPGVEFPAEIVIKKGSVGGFAKLQIDLPAGFSAKEVDSKGATFSFANGAAKYIWTALPADDELKIKLMITPDGGAAGAKLIQGKFSYIVNNNKQQSEFGPVEIQVGSGNTEPVTTNETAASTATATPSNTVTATTPTTSSTNTTSAEPFNTPKDPNAAVSVTRTINANNPKEFEVFILIRKENVKGFAKYVDKIPAGMVATATKTNGASFTFTDQTAKFVWVSLPNSEDLKISYKLEVQNKPSGKAFLNGEFSYLENDQTQKIKADQDEIFMPEETIKTPETNTVTAVTNTVEPITTNTVAETPTNTVVPTNTVEPVTTNTVQPVTTNTVEPVTTKTVEPVTSNTTDVATTSKGNGSVSFNVQIGAFKSSVSADRLASMYNISDNIRTEMHEGYTKFLVGNYDDYKSARDKRENIKNKGVTDAFVTAYNNAKRITVQEALMIANQKWLR